MREPTRNTEGREFRDPLLGDASREINQDTPQFHQGSTRFCEGCGVVRALKSAPHAVGDFGISPELLFVFVFFLGGRACSFSGNEGDRTGARLWLQPLR